MPGRIERFQDVTNIWEYSLRPGIAPGRNEYLGIFVTSWNRSLRPGLYGALWAPMGPYGAL